MSQPDQTRAPSPEDALEALPDIPVFPENATPEEQDQHSCTHYDQGR